jgi:hypothetical protein
VTPLDIATLVEQYHAGIEAELRLLRQLEIIAERQHDVTVARNFEAFGQESNARDQLTRSLVTIEEGQRAVRKLLAERRTEAESVPGFDRVVALHREASELVAKILTTDRDSFRALADAELARRAALSALDQGEVTLAAYRKVLAPQEGGAHLVDKRG